MAIPIKPMLAKKAPDGIPTGDFMYETKWDGMRVIVRRYKDRVRLWTRRGLEVTDKFPELLDSSCFQRPGIFDGEIVCFDQHGKSNFRTVVGRRHNKAESLIRQRSIEAPAHCMIFDCLHIDDEDLTNRPWHERRECLEKEVMVASPKNPYILSETHHDGNMLFEEIRQKGLEGVMAKDIHAPYYPGKRRCAWLKIKLLYTEDVRVVGFTAGQGKREGYFGSLIITDPNGNPLGNVGTGFTDAELKQYMAMFKENGLSIESEDGVTMIQTPIPAEVRHMERTVHNALREPVFMRFRTED